MPDKLPTIDEAKALKVFFGKKFADKSLGELCTFDRGLLWIHWVAGIAAVNGPQPREQRIHFHRACQVLAEAYEMQISAAIEAVDTETRKAGDTRKRYANPAIKPTVDVEDV